MTDLSATTETGLWLQRVSSQLDQILDRLGGSTAVPSLPGPVELREPAGAVSPPSEDTAPAARARTRTRGGKPAA